MAYRIRKQITISIIVILFLALVGVGVYYVFLKPGSTCFDGIKNQDEEEIDCGGSQCVSCEIKTLKEVEVVWTQVIPLVPGVYDLAAKIRNPNPNFGNPGVKYELQLKDKSGQIVGKKSGMTFILPNSTKYIIENNFQGQGQIDSVQIKIDTGENLSWLKLKNYQTPDIYVKGKKFEIRNETNFFAEASGVVKNSTTFGFDKVDADIVLFDSNSKLIGAAKSEMRTLKAGEERYFSVRWFSPIAGEVKFFDMQAETNLFSDDNYMRVYGVPQEQ